jgi:ribonucleoside-diphosphate reductase alpha chain
MPRKRLSPALTPNARTVLESRYLLKDDQGAIVETPGQLFERVARAVASVESREKNRWAERYYDVMAARRFIPNSPTLMNAGKPEGQLSACFVLPIEDSLEGIFETLKKAAKIHQSGGGTGFSFSRLRPQGARVRSSQGAASGPVSFMRIFDTATETIKQGGTRRGANMAILRADHPDIFDFVDAKRDQRAIVNFNLSVGVTDEFMRAVEGDKSFRLRDPRDGRTVREIQARELFDRIAQAAWECGDPGLVFLDRINLFNPTPQLGPMESTNPCGEQPLLPYESCNLGSLNLGLYLAKNGEFDWAALREDIHLTVRFLDSVIDLNHYPVEECRRITLRNRKIGLGVMGFADLLMMQDIPYDRPEAVALGERVMGFVDREAKAASAALAKRKGAFPNWKGSLWQRLGYPKLRNATVSTVAPTGTISIIAGASSGIEPIFSGVFYRNVLSGARLVEVHPAVGRMLRERGLDPEKITEERIAAELGAAWRPARKISVENHVKMQAVFQRSSDSAVSKTINLPETATRGDVARAYRLAYLSGCKGITVYRDKSRGTQVLETGRPECPPEAGGAEKCAIC